MRDYLYKFFLCWFFYYVRIIKYCIYKVCGKMVNEWILYLYYLLLIMLMYNGLIYVYIFFLLNFIKRVKRKNFKNKLFNIFNL